MTNGYDYHKARQTDEQDHQKIQDSLLIPHVTDENRTRYHLRPDVRTKPDQQFTTPSDQERNRQIQYLSDWIKNNVKPQREETFLQQ